MDWLLVITKDISLLLIIAPLFLVIVYYLVFVKYKPRDWRFLIKGARWKLNLSRAISTGEVTSEFWYKRLSQVHNKDRAAIMFKGRPYSFGEYEAKSNQVAHFAAKHLTLSKNESVALYMSNRPEYPMIWLGISKISCATALINTNIKNEALVHSLNVSGAKTLIFGADLADNIREIAPQLQDWKLFCWADSPEEEKATSAFSQSILTLLNTFPITPVERSYTPRYRGGSLNDPVLYVYTSGTTGLPKAGIINHYRFRAAAVAFSLFYNINKHDRVYTALPLYHSAGGMVGIGTIFAAGATVVLRQKFSASQFWDDCRQYRVTVIQYIGELCRYLLAQPPKPDDRDNQVRLALGNGLRPEIWKQFKSRFNIGQIGEFYAATEGAGALLNVEDKDYAIGFMSALTDKLAPLRIVQFDIEKEEPIRDPNTGLCIECKANESGEFLVKVMKQKGLSNFSGYRDEKATQKKILNDVVKKGDKWFRSGDLLRRDEDGFVYFVDRIGDTFRWKGENIATSEVAKIISEFSPSTSEPNVYGVPIMHHDGKAGMVAFASSNELPLTSQDINWGALGKYVKKELASQACPLFARVLTVHDLTGTFKHRKVDLVREGFNPDVVKDPLFFLQDDTYVPLTHDLYHQIVSGNIKL